MTETERVTDKTLRAWLNTGPVDRGIGGGLTFVATAAGALKGQASWILRYRFGHTARTHMAALSVDRFVAERALNHKVRDVEGVYNQYDYFEERRAALERWAKWLAAIEKARNGGAASTQANEEAMAALAKQAQELGMGYERSGRR